MNFIIEHDKCNLKKGSKLPSISYSFNTKLLLSNEIKQAFQRKSTSQHCTNYLYRL